MMPIAPTLTSIMTMPASRPKIGFSIDSIVGSKNANETEHGTKKPSVYFSPNSEGSERLSSPQSDDCYNQSELNYVRHYLNTKTSPIDLQNRISRLQQREDTDQVTQLPDSPPPSQHLQRSNTITNLTSSINRNSDNLLDRKSPPQTRLSPDNNRSQTPPQTQSMPVGKGPIVVPGIPAGLVRPFPVAPNLPPNLPHNLADVKPMPPYLNPGEMVQQHHPHFLAAQFQMAAALAHQNGGFPPQHPAHAMPNPNMPRDSYPLYPWLLSRHGRIFPHRFPGSFLLQPFRKPKRVRTAFSPSQLLKLEHAFESNHYVVGAERKSLAQALSLTETQVKVWFQNRRTKHKRMDQEDDAKNGGQSKNQSADGYDDDELIDMEMDDECPSDEEEEQHSQT